MGGVISLGLAVGSTWKHEGCERRAFAARLHEQGLHDVAEVVLYGDRIVAEPYELVGQKRPRGGPKEERGASGARRAGRY